MKKQLKKGFTLTELVIVIVIIAILAAVLIPSMTGYVNRAKKSNATQEAASTYTVLSAWLIDNTDAYGYEGKAMEGTLMFKTDADVAGSTNTSLTKKEGWTYYSKDSGAETYTTAVTADTLTAETSYKVKLTAPAAFKEYLANVSDTTVAKLKTTVTALTVTDAKNATCTITSSNGFTVTITIKDNVVEYSDPSKVSA